MVIKNKDLATMVTQNIGRGNIHNVKAIKETWPTETEGPYLHQNITYFATGKINAKELKKQFQEYRTHYKKEDPFYGHVTDLIYQNLTFPEKWHEQEVQSPNIAAKQGAMRICFHLYSQHDFIPIRIVPSIEEGITIFYKSFTNKRSLIIEVYNNVEIAAIVNDDDNKKILYSEDIKNYNFSYILSYYE